MTTPTARTVTGASYTFTSVTLTWTADTATPAPAYEIQKSTTSSTSGFTPHATGSTKQDGYEVTGLGTGAQYWFKVIGSNSDGSAISHVVGPITPTMVSRTNKFSGTDEVVLTTANSGGTSGNAFEYIYLAPKFDTARSHSASSSIRVQDDNQSMLGWLWTLQRYAIYFRAYIYLTAYPSSTDLRILCPGYPPSESFPNGSLGIGSSFTITSTGQMRIGTTTSATSTTVIALNKWVRIEGLYTQTANTLRCFNDTESRTPTEEITALTVRGEMDRLYLGITVAPSPVATQTYWMDDLAVSEGSWIGSTPIAPTARTASAAVSGATSVTLSWNEDLNAWPLPTYTIQKSTNGSTFSNHVVGVTNQIGFEVTGLVTGQQYWFKVIGTNSAGSATSNTVGPVVPVSLTTGYPKVWTGSAWASKPAKVWNGSAWVTKPVKVWTGSAWKSGLRKRP